MKKTIITLTLIFVAIIFSNAQKIESEKIYGGFKYFQEGTQKSMGDLVEIMKTNDEALPFMKKASSNNIKSRIFYSIGGGLIGWSIGGIRSSGQLNRPLVVVGAGLIVVGIPFSKIANKNAKQAIDIYNSSVESTSFVEEKTELKIGLAANGLRLRLEF